MKSFCKDKQKKQIPQMFCRICFQQVVYLFFVHFIFAPVISAVPSCRAHR